MHQTSKTDLDDTVARLDEAIEEFHRLRDTMPLSTAEKRAEQEEALIKPPLVSISG